MADLVVSGYMVRHPVPGNLYAFLHYVIGLRRLGHRVLYVESGWSDECYHVDTHRYDDDPTSGIRTAAAALARHGERSVPVAYLEQTSGRLHGLSEAELRDALERCDLLLNVGGSCWTDQFDRARCRALVDMDPLFTQVGVFAPEGFEHYHVLFTNGTNIGAPGCLVPTAGRDWLPTLPPVVARMWRLGPGSPDAPFTTVANWSAYGSVEYQGTTYGQKDVEFLKLADLPARSGQKMVLAAAGCDDEGAERLGAGGWVVDNAAEVNRSPARYRAFVAGSAAELSPAKHGYVTARTGWFSDRSVCYLGAGRPVVVQDTGARIPAGEGILTFADAEEALAAVDAVRRDWPRHSRAARRLARETFGHDVVLPRLLEQAGVRPIG
ncbi:MAG TPA: hypothetical protein VE990_14070 [Acidimicrobiales bacterium]|nr:hypothetical protein [Acidimicrobiales bacterium]